ncbi:hypothetical protein FANTH_14065 [Fusarium anthophilum]|uniref:Heterokaryon incompatibility domain-containing protein n=1 Tax=Fusarium anthophilum TaxID=48485 RepID=A0A8H4YKY2_9HYPO|nr:hypothetical protein FANTH_14065 [Fusarium anthophilum]
MTASNAAQHVDLDAIEQIEMLLQDIRRRPQSRDLAEGALLSTLNLSEEKLGKDHNITIHVAFELAKFYRVKKDFAMAESAVSRVVQDCNRVYGESHVITLEALCGLASALDGQDDLERCKAVLILASAKYRDLNPYGKEALFCEAHLAHTMEALEMCEDAGLLFLDLVEKHRQANTIQDSLGLNCVLGLISNYCKKAFSLFQGCWKNDDDKKRAREYFFECVALCQIIASNEGEEAQETLYYSLWPMAKIALWLGDEDTFQNCVWFLDSTKSSNSSRGSRTLCDGCNQQISQGYHYVCRQCEDRDFCHECFTTRRGQFDMNSESCKDHSFFTISPHRTPEEPNIMGVTAVAEWLSSLLAETRLQNWQFEAAKAGGEELPLDIDDWNDRYPKDISVDVSSPVQELHFSELSQVYDTLQRHRICIAKTRIPAQLHHVFSQDGFRSNDLHQWCLTEYKADDSSETIYEAFSSLMLQAQPPQKSLVCRGKTTRVPYSLPPDSIYAGFRLDPKMQEIRVLDLLPGTGEIECTLRTVSLLQNPCFEALSYVWGSAAAQNNPTIIVEGKRITVTPNLLQALLDLRQNGNTRTVWADAVCINQEDNSEKESQVLLMAEVYKQASRVLIHLCAQNDSFTLLFRFLNRNRLPRDQGKVDEELKALGIGKWPLLKALLAFCSLPWWSRLWTQQEYALATKNPIFYCGRDTTLPQYIFSDLETFFKELGHLLLEFKDPEADIYFKNVSAEWTTNLTRAIGILNRRHFEGQNIIKHLPLRIELQNSMGVYYTHPLDIIYGRAAFAEPIVRALFPPDYVISQGDLYMRLAVWSLMFEGWILMFWYFPYRKSMDLPSWVPDFYRLRDADTRFKRPTEVVGYQQFTPTISKGVLALGGYYIDTVDRVFIPESSTPFQELARLWHLDQHLTRHCKRSRGRGKHYLISMDPILSSNFILSFWDGHGGWPIAIKQVSIHEFSDVLLQTFEHILEKMERFCQTHEEYHTVSSLRDIQNRLVKLRNALLPVDIGYDILGAALFDHIALLQAISSSRDTKVQRLESCSYRVLEDVNTFLSGLRLTIGDPGSQTDTGPVVPDKLRINSIDYGHMIATILDCQFEQEAKLRIALVKIVISKIRNLFDRNGDRRSPVESLEAISQRKERHTDHLLALIATAEIHCQKWRELAFERNPEEDVENDPDVIRAEQILSRLRHQHQAHIADKVSLHSQDSIAGHMRLALEQFIGRTFFLTKGGLVGYSPPGTRVEKGDKVIMLTSCNNPFVIRQTEDPKYHTVVGFGGIRGLDNGELHNLPDDKKPPVRIFKLK